MKAVIDTNVIVSAFLSSHGKPAAILHLFFNDEIQVCYSDDILAEYEDVLSRPALNIKPEKVARFFDILREAGTQVVPIESNDPLPDEDDRTFYDTAQQSGAILITGNVKHFPSESFIKTPSDFLELIHY
ncbi:MAG: putative toxin-antitoxin system toxin component, PIN family [Defluviitaleaceae bacterium]|jgi:putative PIN family toxin of toxin-antitoxin system|nr:putative toxin-antitoxin system toxin component, PIN family [Defluviitaleaceae bacterium]